MVFKVMNIAATLFLLKHVTLKKQNVDHCLTSSILFILSVHKQNVKMIIFTNKLAKQLASSLYVITVRSPGTFIASKT